MLKDLVQDKAREIVLAELAKEGDQQGLGSDEDFIVPPWL